MNIIKKFSLWLFGSILALSLFGFATFFAFDRAFNNPEELKTSLETSGIYEIPLDSVIEENIEEQSNQTETSLKATENKIVGEAVNKAFPEETLKDSAEQVIDGTFAWLRGESAYPDFRLDFSEERLALVNEIADGAVKRVETLEPCTAEQLQAIDLNNIDAFALQCRPPLDLGLQKQLVLNNLRNNNEILEDPVLSGEELLEEFGRRDTAGIADSIPTGFQWVSRLPLLFGLVAATCGIAIILLSQTKRKGLHKLGVVLLSTGLMLIVIQVIVTFLLSRSSPGDAGGNPQLEIAVINFIEDVSWKFSRPIFIIAGLYTATGLGILLVLRLKKSQPQSMDESPSSTLNTVNSGSGLNNTATNSPEPGENRQ